MNVTNHSLHHAPVAEQSAVSLRELASWVHDYRERTFELVADLSDDQLMGPRLPIVNPLLWEIGHTAWFEEKWVLRHACGELPIRSDGDSLYDSTAIPHDTRWDLPLPSRAETLRYMCLVRERVLERLSQANPSQELIYHAMYCVFHGDMHNEAFTYTRQTLGLPAPRMFGAPLQPSPDGGALPGDAAVPGGEFLLGATRDEPFVFDNEKWAHPVEVRPFAIARAAVTQAEFREFVEDGGYHRKELWSDAGWHWREAAEAQQPLYWKQESPGNWMRRHFDQWLPLEPHHPVIHVNWFEAEAYCRWTNRRLPSEAEWEAAAVQPEPDARNLSTTKRRFPWGDQMPRREQANLDWVAGGVADVAAFPAGDTAYGCRQMIGNIWEWTSTPFLPYPGFVPDPYREYSQPWFGTHNVLRGGCWATRSRLIRNTYRNFYTPDRRDVWAGFRTCRPQDSTSG